MTLGPVGTCAHAAIATPAAITSVARRTTIIRPLAWPPSLWTSRDGHELEADGALPDRPRHWFQPARRLNSRSSPESFGDGFTFARHRRPSHFLGRSGRRGCPAVGKLGSAVFVGRASSGVLAMRTL